MIRRKQQTAQDEQTSEVRRVISTYSQDRRFALAILQDLQAIFGYIPRIGLQETSKYLSITESHLYAMATFYKALSLTPKGKHIIKLCDGTACHIKGSSPLSEEIMRILGIAEEEITEDGLFSLQLVNCLGSCALAPAILIDETYYGKVTIEQLPKIFDLYRHEGQL